MLESCQKSMSSGVKRYKWWRTGRWEVAIKTTVMGELVKTLAKKYFCFEADIFLKKILNNFAAANKISFGSAHFRWSKCYNRWQKNWHGNLNVHLKSQRCFPKTKHGIKNQENVIKDEEKMLNCCALSIFLYVSEYRAISSQKNRVPETMRYYRFILRIQMTENVNRKDVLMKMGTERTLRIKITKR